MTRRQAGRPAGYRLPALILLVLAACGGSRLTESALHGLWEGEGQGQRVEFRFKPNRRCTLRFINQDTGAAAVYTGEYLLDFGKRPIPLTIKNVPQLAFPLHTIVEFEADGSLRVAPFAPRLRLRPITLEPERSVLLRRAADAATK